MKQKLFKYYKLINTLILKKLMYEAMSRYLRSWASLQSAKCGFKLDIWLRW